MSREDDRGSIQPMPMAEFDRLPVIEQLRYSFTLKTERLHEESDQLAYPTAAVLRALETSKTERERLGLYIVAVGDLREGKVVTRNDTSLYSVKVVFPHTDNAFHLVSTFNNSLSEGKASAETDLLVNEQADEVQEEVLVDRQRRLLHEIKFIDATIGMSKDDNASKRKIGVLYERKRERILQYLEASVELAGTYPYLGGLFARMETKGEYMTLLMRKTADQLLIDRTYDPQVFADPKMDPKRYYTRINQKLLQNDYYVFLQDPINAANYLQRSAGICRILQLPPIAETKTITPSKEKQEKKKRKRPGHRGHKRRKLTSQEETVVIEPEVESNEVIAQPVVVVDLSQLRVESAKLATKDTTVNPETEVQEESMTTTYNTHIAELRLIDQAFRREEDPEALASLTQKKLSVLASYLEKAKVLRRDFPYLTDLYSWNPHEDRIIFRLHMVKDEQDEESLRKMRLIVKPSITYDELRREYNTSPEGRENVTKIYEALGVQVDKDGKLHPVTVFKRDNER